MKTLIGIAGCHEYRARADAQRMTWMKDVGSLADVRFFLGTPHSGKQSADEIWLECPDNYVERKQKVIAIIRWALEKDYDYLWKVDDDVYLRPDRLLSLEHYDYCGAIVGDDRVFSGAIYGLSRDSMNKLLTSDTADWQRYEDIWVWHRLSEFSVSPSNMGGPEKVNGRFRMTASKRKRVRVKQEPPHPNNDVIASWEHETLVEMQQIHANFESPASV